MAVTIRFTRLGRTHAPMYRIIAIDSRNKRDGKSLEVLGSYNPKTKEIMQWNEERVQYWLSVGAQITDAVVKLHKIMKKRANNAQDSAPAATEVKKTVRKKTAPKKEVA